MKLTALGPLFLLTLCLAAGPARAVESGRVSSTPTGWWHLYGATEAQITNLINTEGARLVDLEVASTGPILFNATFVHNSGDQAVSGWWWYYGVTVADITNYLNANQARLIDLRRYDDAGQTKFACVMVNNTGAEARGWWWLVGASPTDITNLINANTARLIGLSSYATSVGRAYDAVFISNTGADAKAWWWYYGVTGPTVTTNINANQARLYDWNVYTDGGVRRFDVVMVQNTGGSAVNWWWYYDTSVSNIVAKSLQNGARVFDIESYDAGGLTAYGALMINNSNALTTRIAGILGYGSDGATGLLLERSNGSVLASLQPDYVFEPASSIKALIALHFMRRVQAGSEAMGALHTQYTGASGSCPLDTSPVSENYRASLYRMLKNSDNNRAQFFRQRYGNEDINLTATSVVGMTGSQLRHRIGCADSAYAAPNQLTLADNALMYRKIFNSTVLNSTWRDSLRQYLVNEKNYFPIQTKLETIVDQEAALMGMTSIAADYKDGIRYAFKAGSYGLCYPTCEFFYSIGGWVLLPLCNGRIAGNEYQFGIFIHGASTDAGASDRLWEASAEIFRDEVKAGLTQWWNACVLAAGPPRPPSTLALAPPRPNPSSSGVTLVYSVPFASTVRLSIVDLAGREVAKLVQRVDAPGSRTVSWNARGDDGNRVAPGVYFVRLQGAGDVRTQKLVLRQ